MTREEQRRISFANSERYRINANRTHLQELESRLIKCVYTAADKKVRAFRKLAPTLEFHTHLYLQERRMEVRDLRHGKTLGDWPLGQELMPDNLIALVMLTTGEEK